MKNSTDTKFGVKLIIISLVTASFHIFLPVRVFEDFAFSGVSKFLLSRSQNFSSNIRESKDFIMSLPFLMEEIASLKAENLRLLSEIALLKEEKYKYEIFSENNSYKKFLSDENFLLANIIGEFKYPDGTSYYMLDKGNLQGVQEGIILSYQNNLLGIVSQVYARGSKVASIFSKGFSAPCFNSDSAEKFEGICETDFEGQIVIKNINPGHKLSVGDTIVSSGKSGIMRSGLILGKVSKVKGDTYDLDRVGYIEHNLKRIPEFAFLEVSTAE